MIKVGSLMQAESNCGNEMMSCGKHVIATNYSAHTEFCSEENCRLIKIDKLESAYDGKWFFHQGQWGSLGDKQHDSIVKNLREIHRSKQDGLLGVNIAGIVSVPRGTNMPRLA